VQLRRLHGWNVRRISRPWPDQVSTSRLSKNRSREHCYLCDNPYRPDHRLPSLHETLANPLVRLVKAREDYEGLERTKASQHGELPIRPVKDTRCRQQEGERRPPQAVKAKDVDCTRNFKH